MQPSIKEILHTADGIKDVPMKSEGELLRDELRSYTLTDNRQFYLTAWVTILSAAAVGFAIGFAMGVWVPR